MRSRVLSDWQTAVKNYAIGRFSKEALAILAKAGRPETASSTIVWLPAHVTTEGDAFPNLNETAHRTARDMTDRAERGNTSRTIAKTPRAVI